MSSDVLLCIAIPESHWQATSRIGLASLEALEIEQRMTSDVNLEKEEARYTQCCDRLEALAIEQHLEVEDQRGFDAAVGLELFPAIEVDVLSTPTAEADWAVGGGDRLQASFWPPAALASHLAAFKDWAKQSPRDDGPDVSRCFDFLNWAVESRCGVVQVIVTVLRPRAPALSARSQPTLPRYQSNEAEVSTTAPGTARDRLRTAIRTGFGADQVNVSNYHNEDLTRILHEFAFDGSPKSRSFPIVYTDGSRGEDFVFPANLTACAEVPQADIRTVKLALVSMRHPELDARVDGAWFRNTEASRGRPYGETERGCRRRSLEALACLRGESVAIELYQTGLELAIVSFYAALLEELAYRRTTGDGGGLWVTPMFRRDREDAYDRGPVWGSPDAL